MSGKVDPRTIQQSQEEADLSLDDLVRRALIADPETGIIRWRIDRFSGVGRVRKAGTIAGCRHKVDGYIIVTLGPRSKQLRGHHIVWFLHYGRWPKRVLDHINGVRDDNRISNLREATIAQNTQNSKRRHDNKSGFKGVVQVGPARWSASIKTAGKQRRLGTFATPEEAGRAYEEAARSQYGDFARMS